MTPALVLVDVQRDYLQRDDLTPAAEVLVAALAGLLADARARGWPVFHVQTRVRADASDAMPHWRAAGQALCVEGSEGAQAPEALTPEPGEPVVVKRFYSGFEDGGLASGLRAAGVDTLVVAGVHTHACVRATITDAYAEGFAVFLPTDGVASYDADHAARTLDWLEGRAARCLPMAEVLAVMAGETAAAEPLSWTHRNPADAAQVLGEVELARDAQVGGLVERIVHRQRDWRDVPLETRAARLTTWKALLEQQRDQWVQTLIREVGKPRIDAEGEVRYGLNLLDNVIAQLLADDPFEHGRVRYRPHGAVGLITPWNNPFAIPIGKIAPALGYGNGVVWKPALPASGLSRALHKSLSEAGLGDVVGLLTGDGRTGELLANTPSLAALSFTGSIPVGRRLARVCAGAMRPFQGELGGNNAAIVLQGVDLTAVAQDLAMAMFSFAGQRCTAIRRVIVERPILAAFTEALVAAVEALKVGQPADPTTQVGPVISKARQVALLAIVDDAVRAGGRVLTGGAAPADLPAEGCWIAPTVLTDLALGSPVAEDELFGPVVALLPADDLDAALVIHNGGEHGLLGALFSNDKASQARFLAEAQAGLLVLNTSRPAFAGAGPFVGWKGSGYGVPEHGRWNRDFYTRVQAVYG